MKILSAAGVRASENAAHENGVSFDEMMETAGRGCAEFILRRFPRLSRIAILIGKGKNGGDGYVCARILAQSGKSVTVIRLFREKSDPLSERMRDRLPGCVEQLLYPSAPEKAEEKLRNAELIADAVFGIGFRGTLPESVRACICAANRTSAVRIAIDLPSGVGECSEELEPFRADYTLSMLCLKREQVCAPYRSFCGKTYVIPIGIPAAADSALQALTAEELRALLPLRPYNANKGTFGNTLIFGGCKRMPGAPVLAASGALRCGSGLVTMAIPEDNLTVSATAEPECVFIPLKTDEAGFIDAEAADMFTENGNHFSAIVMGNGMGRFPGAFGLIKAVLENAACPVVLDADGINTLSAHIDILKAAGAPVLLTPHPGEMSRLTGKTVSEINERREEIATEFAVRYGVYLLLKGENTVIASPDGRTFMNCSGSSALARGGSGDVLAGMIGAFLSQGAEPPDALLLGAYLHGLAGELSEKRNSSYAATTKALLETLPQAFLNLQESV